MTARYVTGCCDRTVAEIEVSGDRVTISPPAGEELYRVKAPPRGRRGRCGQKPGSTAGAGRRRVVGGQRVVGCTPM
jgi:hypothetical protein